MQYDLFEGQTESELKPEELEGKKCIVCKTFKPYKDFNKNNSHRDKRDQRCRSCAKHQSFVLKEIKKVAPPKTDYCQCCGSTEGRSLIVLDHDHITDKFRGWVCKNCNTGIGLLGDNIEGLETAIKYLRKTDDSI